MDIKIQSTQFVKPSNPTPQNLRKFKLSRLDQLAPSRYIDMILYYKTTGDVDNRHKQLVKSLSDVLTLYYPLAGRITQDGLEVDCNDQGVKYLETRVAITLDDFLNRGPQIDHIGQLVCAPDLVTNTLVTVQVNIFDCGSIAIGVSASHKVTDGYNLVRFINEWASMNKGNHNATCRPSLESLATLFQPMEVTSLNHSPPVKVDHEPVILTKRYVFNRSAIGNLKAKAGLESSSHSKVTLVTSLIWKALISVDEVKYGQRRDCLLAPAMNLRGKLGLLVSRTSFGNVWIPYPIRFFPNKTKCVFHDLMALVEETTRDMINWISKASGEEICTRANACYNEVFEERKQKKFCIISSWCRFGVYEADFGWGKPCWASITGGSYDRVALMDDKNGDGIEAWVSLNEKDMHLFEQDQDIITFSS